MAEYEHNPQIKKGNKKRPDADRRLERAYNQLRFNCWADSEVQKHRRGISENPFCKCCGEEDTTEHIFLKCQRPGLPEARKRMQREIKEEHDAEQAAEDRRARLDKKKPRKISRAVGLNILQHHAGPVLDFVRALATSGEESKEEQREGGAAPPEQQQ